MKSKKVISKKLLVWWVNVVLGVVGLTLLIIGIIALNPEDSSGELSTLIGSAIMSYLFVSILYDLHVDNIADRAIKKLKEDPSTKTDK